MKNSREHSAAAFFRGEDAIDRREADLQRFLAEHRLAGLQQGHGGLGVRPTRSRDADRPHRGVANDLFQTGCRVTRVFFGKRSARIRSTRKCRHEPRAVISQNRSCMDIGDRARADDGESDGIIHGGVADMGSGKPNSKPTVAVRESRILRESEVRV